jgi:hypothetical protein
MLKKNGAFSLPTIPRNLKQCNSCMLGKHSKQPFHDSTSGACRKIVLIHFDLCGPMLIASFLSNKDTMNFIDDDTRMCWAYLLKHKYQAFETLNFIYVWIENEAQSNIGNLGIYNGGEYTSNEFQNYPHQHGIKNQTIFPYHPR